MRSDGATAVDVEVHPQHLRLGRSQTNFALEAIESARPERNESQCCCAGISMARKCAGVSQWACKQEETQKLAVIHACILLRAVHVARHAPHVRAHNSCARAQLLAQPLALSVYRSPHPLALSQVETVVRRYW